jgi:hypothetical protein
MKAPHTLCLLLAGMLSACFVSDAQAHGARDPGDEKIRNVKVRSTPHAKWTIMVFMNGDNNLDAYALADFAEIAEVTLNPLVNVVIQLDRIGGNDTNESWGETRRFVMRKGLKPTRAQSVPNFHEESNMGDPSALASFVGWGKRSFPAERYMLIIWSHGDGWRRLIREDSSETAKSRGRIAAEADELLLRRQTTDSKLAALNLMPSSLEPQFRTISEDETNGFDRLYVREIQDGLEAVFKDGRRLDVIGFDACLMQMIETGYAMRNVADVMIGSEELVPLNGWQYDDWLQALAKDPDSSSSMVGQLIVDSYRTTYEREEPDATLSAVKISKTEIERLATAISIFSRELIISLETELPQIRRARLNCFVFAPMRGYHGIDLYHFCAQFVAEAVRPQLKTTAHEVMKLIESMVIRNYAGTARQGQFGSSGLAIYFPADNAAYQADKFKEAYTDENELQVVQFVRDHIWDNFLHAYFKHV